MLKKMKDCLICKNIFRKPSHESYLQWEKRKFCSPHCARKNPILGKHTAWNKGRKWEESVKKKVSQSRLGKCLGNQNAKGHKPNCTTFGKMENHPHWLGGISKGENKREYYRKKCLERVARKNDAIGSHTLEEWLSIKIKYGFMCLCCKKNEPEIKLTEDHIIPLSRGGSDYIGNIQPLCGSCNSIKNIHATNFTINQVIV